MRIRWVRDWLLFAAAEQPGGWLAALVLLVAFLYSSVGFGGASGYLALMAWFEVPINIAASTALSLNLIVAGIAFITYYRGEHFVPRLFWPFVLFSIPAAFLGGRVRLAHFTYLLLLNAVLLFVAVRMLLPAKRAISTNPPRHPVMWVMAMAGFGLGFLAGMVGIGGGVFLSPLIILSGWGTPKQSAATAAGFIFLNSLSGLIGRVTAGTFAFGAFGWGLLPLGVIGSMLGSRLGVRYFSGLVVRRILAVILLITVIRFFTSQLF